MEIWIISWSDEDCVWYGAFSTEEKMEADIAKVVEILIEKYNYSDDDSDDDSDGSPDFHDTRVLLQEGKAVEALREVYVALEESLELYLNKVTLDAEIEGLYHSEG